MKKFKDYLIEITMTFDKALEVFGMDAEKAADKLALKKKYRDLAKQHHPDHGGDAKMFREVGDAYEVLSKAKISKSGVDWDAIDAKYRRWGLQIKTSLLSNFRPEIFTVYFKEQSGYDYNYEIIRTFPLEKERSPNYAGFDVEFFTKDRSTVFTMTVHATLSNVINNKSLGHGDDISYTVVTTAVGFHLNKKQKMSQRDWKWTNDHSFFRKPEMLFPVKKMKAIFSGKTSNRKFKKRDMETFLEKKLGATFGSQDFVYIPLGEDYKLTIYRSVIMKQAAWGINGIYQKHSRVAMAGYFSFMEEEETAKIFEKVQKEVMKVKGEAKVKKAQQLLKLAYEAYKKSKGY
jgi:curved DNA-binding protein CbpA